MIVLTLSLCPPKLRGYLTEWFLEIDTGVYVGQASARVRDQLWETITQTVGGGRAMMVYSTNTEQGLGFKTWNTKWQPIDLDGIQLIRRPPAESQENAPRDIPPPRFHGLSAFSCAIPFREWQSGTEKEENTPAVSKEEVEAPVAATVTADYCAVDLETGGLDAETSPIIEIGAARVRGGCVTDTFQCLLKTDAPLPKEISTLTGITDSMLQREGIPLADAMRAFLDFVGQDTVVGHNIAFDITFLQKACADLGLPTYDPGVQDTWIMSKHAAIKPKSYRLADLLKHFGIADTQKHRALDDALLTQQLFAKLNEI